MVHNVLLKKADEVLFLHLKQLSIPAQTYGMYATSLSLSLSLFISFSLLPVGGSDCCLEGNSPCQMFWRCGMLCLQMAPHWSTTCVSRCSCTYEKSVSMYLFTFTITNRKGLFGYILFSKAFPLQVYIHVVECR